MHEAALTAYGLDYEVFLRGVDVLFADGRSFAVLGLDVPETPGTYSELAGCEPPLRAWSRKSLRLTGVVSARRDGRGFLVLDPELVLDKLPYSPDIHYLREQRARLAEVLYGKRLGDEDLLLFDRYVRGD